MLANVGDRVRLDGGDDADSGRYGVFVGDRIGLARVVLDLDDRVIMRPYGQLTILRPIVSETDRLELEVVKLKLAELRRAVADANAVVESPGRVLATKLLLDLVPLVDLLPVPSGVRDALKDAAIDAIEAIERVL